MPITNIAGPAPNGLKPRNWDDWDGRTFRDLDTGGRVYPDGTPATPPAPGRGNVPIEDVDSGPIPSEVPEDYYEQPSPISSLLKGMGRELLPQGPLVKGYLDTGEPVAGREPTSIEAGVTSAYFPPAGESPVTSVARLIATGAIPSTTVGTQGGLETIKRAVKAAPGVAGEALETARPIARELATSEIGALTPGQRASIGDRIRLVDDPTKEGVVIGNRTEADNAQWIVKLDDGPTVNVDEEAIVKAESARGQGALPEAMPERPVEPPSTLYHGSPTEGLSEIKPSMGDYGRGVYLADEDVAQTYSQGRRNAAGFVLGDTPVEPRPGTVYAVQNPMKNPLVIADEAQYQKLLVEHGDSNRTLGAWAKAAGYDGIVNKATGEHIAFTDKAIPTEPPISPVEAPTPASPDIPAEPGALSGAEILGRIGGGIRERRIQSGLMEQELQPVRERILRGEGDYPVMSVGWRGNAGPGGERVWFVEVSTAGWPAERLRPYGLIPDPSIELPFGTAYRIADDTPAIPPTEPGATALPEPPLTSAEIREASRLGKLLPKGQEAEQRRLLAQAKRLPPPEDVADKIAHIEQRIATSEAETYADALSDSLKAQANDAGLPPPIDPPALAASSGGRGGGKRPTKPGPKSNDSAGNFAKMLNGIPGEKNERAALRLFDGARRVGALEIERWWLKGGQSLQRLGLGVRNGKGRVLTRAEGEGVLKALHGEGEVPEKLRAVYDDLKKLVDQETSDMLVADPSFTQSFMAHPDYFPRLWRAPKETKPGAFGLGARPGFLKPRVDATFSEMLDSGWEPASWNPYDMMALRKVAGIEYREQQALIQRLKSWGEAVPVQGQLPEGWRVPEVGPAFTGKPFVAGDGQVMFTPRLAVRNHVADVLESIVGKRPELRIGGHEVLGAIRTFSDGAKSAKLMASLFQHVDFATRTGFVSMTPTALLRGSPVKYPSLLYRLAKTTLTGEDPKLVERILSNDPILPNSTISLRMIAEQGWNVSGDTSIFAKSMRGFLEDVAKDAPKGPIGKARERIGTLNRFWQDNLFKGVYRESQIYSLENFLVPALKRNHPDWTDVQIAGSAAEEVNKMFSTLANWQTIFASPAAKEFTRTLIFSTNESEAWIRQFVGGLHGENKRLWHEYGIGALLFLTLTANAINMVSTGEPLPLDAYIPVTANNPYGFWPGGVGYNSHFLSPEMPFRGRNDTKVYIDIVGQADTPIRWMIDPPAAVASRYNVWPRAIMNQVKGKDFYGRPIDTGPGGIPGRAAQFARDLYEPIGVGSLVEAGRQAIPGVSDIVPENEGRIGITGNLVQALGLNLRGEQTRQLLDRMAQESNLKKADGSSVEKWDDLEPYQRKALESNPQFASELAMRNATAVERGDERAKAFQQLKDVDKKRYGQEEALGKELDSKLIDAKAFRDRYGDIQGEAAAEKSRLDTAFQIFKVTNELPEDPNERARVQYYNAWDNARRDSGLIDFDKAETLLAALEKGWTPAQKAYVERNIKLADHPERVKEYLRDKETLKPYWEVREKVRERYPKMLEFLDKAEKAQAEKSPQFEGLSKDPRWKFYQKEIERRRAILRVNNRKTIQAAGFKWDHFGKITKETLDAAAGK